MERRTSTVATDTRRLLLTILFSWWQKLSSFTEIMSFCQGEKMNTQATDVICTTNVD